MNWQPKTEDELAAEELCPKGKNAFTILEANILPSKKNGQEMIKLKLDVHGSDGFDYHVYDYVMPWAFEFKFRHFFYSIGRGQDYESGTVQVENLVGRQGWAEVEHELAKNGYPPKEKISDYVTENAEAKKQVAADGAKAAAPGPEDDVPF